jgi:glucose-6-phosphate 1-dehydrogenase
MHGDTLLFARQDGVEESWRVLDRVLTDHGPAYPYPVHTWGPAQQSRLVDDPDGWHRPVCDPAVPRRT